MHHYRFVLRASNVVHEGLQGPDRDCHFLAVVCVSAEDDAEARHYAVESLQDWIGERRDVWSEPGREVRVAVERFEKSEHRPRYWKDGGLFWFRADDVEAEEGVFRWMDEYVLSPPAPLISWIRSWTSRLTGRLCGRRDKVDRYSGLAFHVKKVKRARARRRDSQN